MTTLQYYHAVLTLVFGAMLLLSVGLIVVSLWSEKEIFAKLGFSGLIVSWVILSILDAVRL